MDEYDKKFAEMQKYIPFLEVMIDRLQKVTDSSRALQLQKMQQLHGILTSKKRKLKLETLKKCEAVLLKLHSKVDKGANALAFPVKKSEGTAEITNDPKLTVEVKLEESPNQIKEPDKAKVKSEATPAVGQQKEIKVKKKMNETPASPSPPASPDPESSSNNIPIVIPTESAPGYASNAIDKPSSPDQCETLSTKKPIVIPTESRLKKLDDKSNSRSELPAGVTNSPVNSFDEWSMLEASEKSASKLGQNNKDSKHNRRHMSVTPSSSAVSRKFSSPSDKNSDSGLSDVAKELIKSNALKQCRNESPPDPFRSKKTSTLLVSPPTDRSAPLLSKSDLAELLNDNPTKNTEKSDKKNTKERSFVENRKLDNERKGTKNPSESIDKDSERRWEEVDKHIVKMTPRNNIPLSNSRSDSLKTELKPQTHSSNNKNYIDNYDRNPRHSSDFRNNPDPNVQIPNINVIKNALSRISEDDYANLANIHIHNEGMTNADDRNSMHHRRAPSHPSNDMHSHRGGPSSYSGSAEPDFRRENLDSRYQDHYDMHSNQPPMHQQPGGNSGFCGPQWRGQNPNIRGHPNGSQLSPRQSHYQHPGNLPPSDNWNVANPGVVDSYSPHHMQNQYGPNLNRGGRSMMSPNNEINFPEDRSLSSSPHSIPSLMSPNIYPQSKFNSFPHENRPIEQPFDRPAEFSRGPARQPWESLQNRTNEAPFERPNEYSHGPARQQWSGQPNRPNEIPYERPVEYPHGPSRQASWDTQPNRTNEPNFHEVPRGRGTDGPYGRQTNTDLPPWNRGNNDPPNRGRGGDRFTNERGRTGDSSYGGYNRRSEWDRPPSSTENPNRFGIRDPRYRSEPTPQQPNNSNISNVRRDPRLVKDNNSQIPTISNKSKENPSSVSRDPRRRNSETKETNKSPNPNNIVLTNKSKVVEKTKDTTIRDDSKSKKPSVDSKPSNENTITEKLKKDIESMKSPLHSLYGAIDTTAKTGKGYGLQKFKIPKIKKPITPRPPTPPRPSPSHFEEKWDVDVAAVNEEIEKTQNDTSDKLQDEKKMEVTSTTEESSENLKSISPTGNYQGSQMSEAEATTKVVSMEVDEDENPPKDIKEESEITVDTSTASKETEIKSQSTQEDSLKVTETVTQELIEALIRKSLESGEGKKLLEQAKLLEKLGEAFNAKKYKKIRKIIDSESESSSSDDKKTIESRKKILKKKKPVIESDSSEEECLANRLDTVKESPPKTPVKDRKTKIDTETKINKSESDSDKKEDAELNTIVDEEILQDDVENKEDDEQSQRSEIEEVKKQIKTPVKKKRRAKRATVKRKTKKVEEVINDEIELPKEDKEEEVTKPAGKQRKQRRRNSLEMLQEDIREMFISEGVVTATGHRMCRLIKEAQGNLPSIEIDDKTNPLVDASSLELLNEMNSDECEFNLRSRSRSSSKRSKTPDEVAFKPKETRTRRCTTKLSKEIISTSDSDDDDDNLVLRNTNSGRRSKDPLAVSPTSDDNLDDSGPTLRRSERVALKEPRVVIEKTELSKIDSSNVFDTSSDESFGIDVTELTAAVDISLHPERNLAGQGAGSSKVSKKKQIKRAKKTKNKKTLDATDRKSNNTPLTFDDDASIASDASVASSNASAVKKSCNPTSTDTNEELITNIIGELASDKEKELVNTSVDKVTDVDNDEYMDTSHGGIKKPQPLKRKKKRASWQMGVVPKSKKRKTCQTTNDSSNSTGVTSEDTKNDSANISNENDLDSGDLTLNENKDKTNTKALSKIIEKKQLSVTIEKIQDTVEELPYPEIELNQLIEYAWTGQERYKCLLCPFSGKNIVHHYIHNHPKNETMISRLTLLDAKRAIDEAKDEEFIKLSEKVNSGPTRKFICRFCAYTFEGEKNIAMEHFYEHCTTHTGEYRFSCKCKYQTTIKSSMRAHYYKICRKSNENFAVSIHEDPIPSEEYIPGYLCSLCNFIQLKEHNIKNHIEKIHKSNSDIEIIKINMSGYLKVKDSVDFDRSFGESMTLKYESDSAEENDSKIKKIEKDKQEAIKTNDDVVEILLKNSLAEKSDPIQDDGDNSLSKKLNAFVCPPELENKEVEIQLERKKKMQEIADNIGLKIQKDTNEKRFSIIDELKNKMTTSETHSVSDNTNVEDGEYLTLHNDEVTERVANDVSELSATQLIDAFDEEPRFKSEFISQTSSSVIHHTSTESCGENTLKIDEEADAMSVEKSDKKMKDPLALFHDDAQKDCNSELEEASDFEAAADVSRPYESDSSDEVSDTEIQTAVSSLLKQTINTSTKVPMMNTIHRLAAQLQGDKSFTATNSEETTKDTEDDADNDLMETDDTFMKLPIITNVVSESVEKESPAQEQLSVIKQTDDSAPKNFIRLRRLPGDLLSTGDSDSNKKISSESSSVSSVDSPTAETGPETTVSNPEENVVQSSSDIVHSGEEEGSFLKIENVVSLAPSYGNPSDEPPLVTNIRKAVGTSPVTSAKSVPVSVLKKVMTPNILKKFRPVNNVDGLYSLPVSSTSNTVTVPRPTSSTPGSKNFKIVKVLRRGSTILKPKDPGQNTAASKLKNPDAYKAMLTVSKLRHLYKCMSRSCSFSTDSCDAFGKHFQRHAEFNSNQSSDVCDYQRCAYCDDLSKTWEDMQAHYKSRHSFCSFQCTYCFYRAFTQSYVELHQKTRHPGKPISVILGMRDYHPAEMIDRREHVLPFICKHECNKLFYVPEAFIAHLKTKHGSTLALFKCHLCETTNFKAELLINHYKMHGIYKYQCLYCLSGADATIELHNHLGTSHCNRPPKILERSLPPQPVRDKDVLLQLIIRNLDDNYKCTELKIVNDGDNNTKQLKTIRPKPPVQPIISNSIISGKNQVVPSTSNIKITGLAKPPIPILPRPTNSANQRSSVKVIGPRDIISILENDRDSNGQPIQLTANTKEMIIKESNNFSHNGGITVLKIAEKPLGSLKPLHVPRTDNSTTNSVKNKNIDYSSSSNSDAMSAMHPEPELELRYVSDQLKTQIVNAVDPLSIPDNPNCQDEFINTNFFDNNEILKPTEQSLLNFDKNEVTKTPDNDDTNNNNNDDDDDGDDADDDDNDSDIEILEYIQHSDKTTNKTNDNQSSVQSTSGESEFKPSIEKIESLNPEDFRNTISEDKLELQDFSNADNSTANNLTEKSNTGANKIFKTLDDIKHTGYAGTDLYKCGYSACDFSAEVPGVLKEHIIQCELANEAKELFCVHCQKRFFKIGYLLDHFKSHGLKRFECSLCNQRFPVSHQAVSHMKMKHKSNHRMLPADPTNPSENGLFILHACKNPVKIKKGKIKGNSKNSKIEEKISFSPADIESLPRQAIYQREVQCAVCPYKTKVRTNIVRHLQLHATEENVPESGPVNPVPCLDKKERMFDKMVNLASSSHQNGRMSTGAPKETVSQNEIESLPKFVPENKRYICSVSLCNYITVEESTLRDHMKALHPEEQYFRCPHCPTPSPGQDSQNIIIDKMGVHLKMHDTKLYKCSHCNHHHYHRHVVERHLTDKHPEKRPFVKVIREIENAENSQPTTSPEEAEDGPCDKDGNYWKCNLCEHKCAYKHEMASHMISTHNEKSQFKCGLCIFKTPSKMSLEQHIVSKHINDDNVDYTLTYERVKGTKKFVESTDQISVDEPFDTTPLWRRDMPRIRHIRGILYEDEPTSTSEASGKASKRKSDAEISSKPAKIKIKSSSLDGTPEKNKIQYKINDVDIDSSINTSVQGHFDLALLEKKYGSYGKPDGERYTCTICNSYKSRYRQDIRDHIYRELQYWRMHCKSCGYMAVSHSYLTKHVNRVHKNTKPEIIAIQPNRELETWVQTLISKQLAIIRGSMSSHDLDSPGKIFAKSQVKSKVDYKKVIPPTITLEDSDSSVVPPATMDTSVESAKKVDLTEKISNMQDVNSGTMHIDSDFNDNDNDDDDDDDDNALVIDSKDDSTIEENKSNKVIKISATESTCTETKSEPEKSLICKHCGAKFSRWRGFKTHVGINHLKRFNFLCPYCDRSVNSEVMMRQHIRNKHPGCPETIINNPAANGPELTDEFWEREYGLIRQKKSKKRKIKIANTEDKFENNDKVGPGDICVVCGFTAINATGLAAHMRAHAKKHTLKCAYCSFTANSKSDVWQHSEINHPLEDWKAEEINTPGTSDQPPQQYTKIRNEQDYSNDIEEEKVANPSNIESIYDCFYCNLRSSSLDSIKKHWCKIHRDYNEASKFKTGVPFRFKESLVNNLSIPKFMKCGYCPKKGSIALMRLHCRKKHQNLPPKFSEAVDKSRDIYICKWCNEVCESNTKMNHHNMCHSHLPIRFRREEEISAVQRGYACTVCDFSNVSLMRVKRHIGKHYDNYRCKRCDENFPTIALATQHSTKEHPSLAAAIEGTISNLDSLLAGITETYVTSNSSTNSGNDDTIPSHEIFRNLGVAKKSTTKQLLRPSTGSVVRAVAKKSTHPLPRYPPGVVFPIDDLEGDLDGQSSTKSEGFSYYGLPREPIDLSNLSTTMTVGSFKTKIECTALAKLFNIDPNVILTDIQTEQKYSSLIQYQAPSPSLQQQPQPSSSLSSLPSPYSS
ncbi:uncharacterized protein LOC130663885 [Microplitis mediator]|uniref:uncharacterized protein LOC130663885 n=1 Tax=Microplitis mediator TaxID=375433 RepID=UPI00255539D3|nr:uncharacterized protein LOC130663885 [Microplitis mediator]